MANSIDKSLKKIDKLGNEKVSRLILSFFATAFISLMLNSIYNLTDTLFISWGVGDIAMSGVAIIAPFVLLQGAISTMIGGGAATLVSLKLGSGNAHDAGKITINAMVVFYTISILVTILGLVFINPLLKLMGVNQEIYQYAKDYLTIILIGNIFSTGFSSIMRAEGKNIYSMIVWMTTIIINIILDAIFILAFKWGVKGAAAATVIGQVVGFILSLLFFTKLSVQKYKTAKVEWKTIVDILKIGLPSLVQMGSLSIVIAMLNYMISNFGEPMNLVAFGYISKLLLYAIAPFMAISQAMAPVVGYNFGNVSSKRVKDSVKFSFALAFIYATIIFLLLELIPKYLIMMFTRNHAIIAQGADGLRIIALVMLLMPAPILIGAKLQAIGDKWWAMLVYGANLIFIIIPAIFLGKNYGMKGLMWSYVIANICSCLLVIIKHIFSKKHIKDKCIDKQERIGG